MSDFTFLGVQQLISEVGAARRLGELCAERHATSVLIVTDAGIRALGLLDNVVGGMSAAGVQAAVFDEVEADPTDTVVLKALDRARTHKVDLVIGFGGGSSMDVAKLVALLAHPSCQQTLADIYGVGQAKGTRLPLIQVPTTAGTGSEVTPIAIVTTGKTTKSGVVSPLLMPDMAVLDAELTLGLPAGVTAATGIDAMVHAIEAYTSRIRKNPLSDVLARQALDLLASNLVTSVKSGHNLEARSAMLLGANLAGQAFANAPVAAVHALAYPLGGHYHIPHGLSNALVLPHVLRFNLESAAPLYAQLAPLVLGEDLGDMSAEAGAAALIDGLESLIAESGLPNRLRDLSVPEDALPMLAQDAMLQQRLLVNNPREVSEEDALAIYRAAF
ncbi:iron-containing alcohol dehydrogenase [Mangrovitalea sediminis]|uniref:iron-containing alcohol dehydrogenase n=1 Tax=Mangrovitalea sediminis TaxID=1982043 RepID=UPI000BE52A7B|nr:iron-containing alcohol dehydrogenase [Mangrovitalea sediminis]